MLLRKPLVTPAAQLAGPDKDVHLFATPASSQDLVPTGSIPPIEAVKLRCVDDEKIDPGARSDSRRGEASLSRS